MGNRKTHLGHVHYHADAQKYFQLMRFSNQKHIVLRIFQIRLLLV